MQQTTETLSALEFEHHQLRKVEWLEPCILIGATNLMTTVSQQTQISSRERVCYLDNQIQKEKDAQLAVYNAFVATEGLRHP